jgi:hypothetical protein
MRRDKHGYRYRMTLDRDTPIIGRICGPQDADSGDPPEAVIEQLQAEQGPLHAIVSWRRPQRVYTDNCSHESARLVRACARSGSSVIAPQSCWSRAKSRAESSGGIRWQVSR